jgi:hypothetical protein
VGVLTCLAATAQPAVALKTSPPHHAFAPSDIHVEVRVPRHEDNRLLIVVLVDGDIEVSRSESQLEGAASRVLFTYEWRKMGAGEYVVTAVVIDALGKERAREVRALRLMTPGEVP